MSEHPIGPPTRRFPSLGDVARLADIRWRIQTARQRAVLSAECELVLSYWRTGHDIPARRAAQGWDAKVIHRNKPIGVAERQLVDTLPDPPKSSMKAIGCELAEVTDSDERPA